ncbi:PRC-barrel domain-containing protein [Gymnodinialimonas sp. 2305UL16-5]|uniref:PRC-barrel domain-containing protein n=1 Tax=Gymnodinialimonas mytili TaxID=3126503 RepID=UPI0030ADCA40
MIAPFTKLTEFSLHSNAGQFRVTDLVFDPADGAARMVLFDDGKWLFNDEMAVGIDRMEAFDAENATWHARIQPGEIREARTVASVPVDITALPPIVIGPFGTTQSPLLLLTQLFGNLAHGAASVPSQLERVSDWIGAPVFGPTGPIAQIIDLHIDTQARRVTEVTLGLGAQRVRVPFHTLRHFVQSEGYAVTDVTEDDLLQGITVVAPGPSLPPAPEQSWVARSA